MTQRPSIRSSMAALCLGAALSLAAGPGLQAQERGYIARSCGFDLNKNGIVGEAADCNVCDGSGTTGADEIYVSCAYDAGLHAAGADTADDPGTPQDESCGSPTSPCLTIDFAFSTIADGPNAGNGHDIVCFRNTCKEENLSPKYSGEGPHHTRPVDPNVPNSEGNPWQYPTKPTMLVGWDVDDDGVYPPHDFSGSPHDSNSQHHSAVLMPPDPPCPNDPNQECTAAPILNKPYGPRYHQKINERTFFIDNELSFLEFAHFTVRDYGRHTLTYNSGFLDLNYHPNGNLAQNDSNHLYFHDIELHDLNRDSNYNSRTSALNTFNWRANHVNFDNMLFTNNGHWFARGGLDSTTSRGPFGWKNISLTLDACKPPAAATCDWETDNDECSESTPTGFCCSTGDVCTDSANCEPTGSEICETRTSTTFKIWGYYHGLEILDSIWDANTLIQNSPTTDGKARGIDMAQCTQDWTVRNNEIIDYNSPIEVNPFSTDSCDGEKDSGGVITTLEARPVTGLVIDRNLIRHPAPTGVLDHGIALKQGGTEYPRQVIGDVTISNNMITSDPGLERCITVETGHGWPGSTQYPVEAVPGTVRLVGNTCYGPITLNAAVLIGDAQGNNQSTMQQDFVVRNNIVGGITTGVANLATTYAPSNFDIGTNVWDPDGKYRWNESTNVQIDFATWQTQSGDTGSSECTPTLLSTDGNYANGDPKPLGGDLHLHPVDTCAQDQGSDVSAITDIDIDADDRPTDNGFDIGADEVAPRPLDQPPLRYSGAPSGLQPYGTTSAVLTVSTDQDARCDVTTTAGLPYGDSNRTDMTTAGGGTYDTSHSFALPPLVAETPYTHHVRCENTNGVANTDDYTIEFTVAGLSTNLVAHWTFDETSGCTAADENSTHDGTLKPDCANDSAPTWVTGMFDGALHFDGGSDYVEVADDPALSFTSSFTVSGWIRPESFGDANYGRIIAKQQYAGGFGNGWSVYLATQGTSPSGDNTFCVNFDTNFVECADDNSINLDAWQHIAVRFDDANDTLNFFVNGQPEGSITTTEDPQASSVPLRIGDRDDLIRSFEGQIDELRLYDRVLSTLEIETLAIAPGAPPLRLNGSPSGNLAASTTSATLELDTNEAATCRWSWRPGIGYGAMNPNHTFTRDTPGKNHQFAITVTDERLYRVHVRCQDDSGDTNIDDYPIEFYVGFHPSDLADVEFFVESRHGITVATGTDVSHVESYCDPAIFSDGCLRRWEDQSGYVGSGGFVGRDFGQDDAEKPGLILDCIAGQPCVRGGFQTQSTNWSQDLGLEIELTDAINDINGPLSVYMLTRPVSQANDFTYMGSGDSYLEHNVTNDSLTLRIGGGTPTAVTGAGAITLDAFQLVEIHRDASDQITVVIDGVDVTLGAPVLAGGFDFRFLFSEARNHYMVGDMAAVLVNDGALTTTQKDQVRQYLHNVYGVLPFGVAPVARFAFDENTGCTTDDDGATYTGSLGPACSGNAPAWSTRIDGSALDFDASDDYVSVPHSTALDMSGSFTLSAWIEPSGFGRNDYGRIASKQQYVGGYGGGYDFYLANKPSGVPAGTETLCSNIGNSNSGCGDAYALDLGVWQHAVVTYDSTSGGVSFYVDGQPVGGYTASGSLGSSAVPLTIGNRESLNRTFEGNIDDLRLFSQALTADQVYDLFMASRP